MQINYDCIRDILLYLETNLTLSTSIRLSQIIQNVSHSEDDVKYSIMKLLEADYLVSQNALYDKHKNLISVSISQITWDGHEYLNSIKDDSFWNKAKNKLHQAGIFSLKLSIPIISELIKQSLI